MNTPDDLTNNQRAANDMPMDREETSSEGPDNNASANPARIRWRWQPEMSRFTARFQRAERIEEAPTGPIPVILPDTPPVEQKAGPAFLSLAIRRLHWRRRGRRDRLRDWQSWSKFRLWRNTRPLWGSLCMIIAGLLMLVSASFFLPLAFLAQSLWPAFLVGGLLLVMGLIQLFLPSYAVITGSIGIVLALVSLLVASFGGCGLGMLLGVIGSALSIAWRPLKRSRLIPASVSRLP